jgi:hypothetical protein
LRRMPFLSSEPFARSISHMAQWCVCRDYGHTYPAIRECRWNTMLHYGMAPHIVLLKTVFTVALSARLMHVTHRPLLARAPEAGLSPESRGPQGMEIAGVVEVASCPQVAYADTAGKRLSSHKAFVVVHPAPAAVSGFYRPSAAPRCAGRSAPDVWARSRRHYSVPTGSDAVRNLKAVNELSTIF